MRKKVLITGVTGFAGTHLTKHLLTKNIYELTGTHVSDDTPSFFQENDIQLFKIDLTNAEAVESLISEHKPDMIFHLAALTSAAKSFENPTETVLSNIKIQINVLEAIRKKAEKTRLLIVSSADAYGMVRPEDLPIDEDTPFRPANPYAVSKVTQDYLGFQYALSYGLDVVRARPFNHIGPGQAPVFVVSSFAKQIAEIEKGEKEPLLLVGNLETKRDFTDVRDIVSAYALLMEKGVSGEVYNIGSGKSYKISDVLDKLLSLATKQIEVKVDEKRLRPIDEPELLCDNTKMKNLTGWEPKKELDETLKDTLDYWRGIV